MYGNHSHQIQTCLTRKAEKLTAALFRRNWRLKIGIRH